MVTGLCEKLDAAHTYLLRENERLERWVDDLQAGMYINCVYCGHRYGPDDEVPASMADALKEHIEQCPKHPMSMLKRENERLREAAIGGGEMLEIILRDCETEVYAQQIGETIDDLRAAIDQTKEKKCPG